ncbi:unnamed protein product [Thlaspi arvense]|uniref:Uncharacterized protein n=1 Tax=Thlaspi arvense TaxID=13288 RepID=A0AAU9RBI2_THLAR|nr:unnamed protein product [Thlaspi arvense]
MFLEQHLQYVQSYPKFSALFKRVSFFRMWPIDVRKCRFQMLETVWHKMNSRLLLDTQLRLRRFGSRES